MYLNRILLISLLLLTTLTGWNQNVISAGNDTTICPNNSVTLTGTIGSYSPNPPTQVLFGPSPGYTTYDDGFSTNWAPIGFTFTYYGNNYTQLLISSNAYLSFTGTPGGYSPWSIASPIPNAANPLNAIMAPWQDTYPGLSGVGSVRYKTVGNAPNRIFIVEYLDIPMFSCGTTFCYGAQIKLFEGTNVIETHIANKPLCSSWNMGRAIHGTHNAAGNIGHPVPGRNSPTQWGPPWMAKDLRPTETMPIPLPIFLFHPPICRIQSILLPFSGW